MKVCIITATEFEINESLKKVSSSTKNEIIFKISGVGMLATSVSLMEIIFNENPDIIIQIGIAGCFDKTEKLGKVFSIEEELLGDLGVIENNSWKDIFDLKLIQPNQKPFKKKSLINKNLLKLNKTNLPFAKSISVNQITTQESQIDKLLKKYNPLIENMEGAALHYIGNLKRIQYLQIRSISNYVGERNKANWKLELAIKNLNKEVIRLIKQL